MNFPSHFFRQVCIVFSSLFLLSAAADEVAKDFVNDPRFDRMEKLINERKNDEARVLLEKMVEEGNPLAMFYLGMMYYDQNDLKSAADWFRRGAELGELSCKFYLAQMLYAGKGVEKDHAAAFKLCKSVADKVPHAEANMMTGHMLIQGEGCQADIKAASKYLCVAADPANDKQNGKGLVNAQLIVGVYFMEEKEFDKAYKYLELAAEQNNAVAWQKLGVLYFEGSGLEKPRLDWAERCFIAAEKISPHRDFEFNLGVIAMEKGDLDSAIFWMKLAAENGAEMAKKFLSDQKTQQQIIAKGKELQNKAKAEKKELDPLKKVQDSVFEHTRKAFGEDGRQIINKLSGYGAIVTSGTYIRLPHNQNIRMPHWEFEWKPIYDEIEKSLFVTRSGEQVMMADEFNNQPLQKNLLPMNPSIRLINHKYEKALIAALNKAPYKKLDKAAVNKLIGQIDAELLHESQEHSVWQISEKIYFHIQTDYSGRWQMRYYKFLVKTADGKVAVAAEFDAPPGKENADMAAGVIQLDKASMNNMAVKLAEGEMDNVFSRDDEAEDIFLFLAESNYLPAVYNLAVYYQCRGRKEEAKKYFDLAEKIAADDKSAGGYKNNQQ